MRRSAPCRGGSDQDRAASFDRARHGFRLDRREQQTRWLLLSLLNVDGVDRAAYRERFDSDVLADFPELEQLADASLCVADDDVVRLTPAGLERTDSIGPWLWSADVHARMGAYELR